MRYNDMLLDLPQRAMTVRSHRSNWRDVVMICRKCTKKVRGGFGSGEAKSMRKYLKKRLDLKKGRAGALGLVEVGCFGLCPKNAVTVVVGHAPGAMYAIPPGTSAEQIVAALCIPVTLTEAKAG